MNDFNEGRNIMWIDPTNGQVLMNNTCWLENAPTEIQTGHTEQILFKPMAPLHLRPNEKFSITTINRGF